MKIETKIVSKAKTSRGAVKGEILEDGVLVGTFSRRSMKFGDWPIQYRFFTSGAAERYRNSTRYTVPQALEDAIENHFRSIHPPAYVLGFTVGFR